MLVRCCVVQGNGLFDGMDIYRHIYVSSSIPRTPLTPGHKVGYREPLQTGPTTLNTANEPDDIRKYSNLDSPFSDLPT